MKTFLRIKNWEKFQHYKDRAPPWIKLHRELLDDYEFSRLQDASKAHLMLIWMLASQLDNRIPNDQEWIAKKIGATGKIDIKSLIDLGFLYVEDDASKPLAECSSEREAETYREEAEEERTPLPPEPDEQIPEGIPVESWDAWKAHRGKDFTKRAQKLALSYLEKWHAKGHDPTEIINYSIMGGYKGLFEPKGKMNEITSRKPSYAERIETAGKAGLAKALAQIDNGERGEDPPPLRITHAEL